MLDEAEGRCVSPRGQSAASHSVLGVFRPAAHARLGIRRRGARHVGLEAVRETIQVETQGAPDRNHRPVPAPERDRVGRRLQHSASGVRKVEEWNARGCSRPASLYDPFGWIDLAILPPD